MNTNLLRRANPADLKVGDPVVDIDGDTATLIAPLHPDTGEFVLSYKDDRGYFTFVPGDDVYLAPLCWVENKPVYPGDVLYRKEPDTELRRQPLIVSGKLEDWWCAHPNGAIYRLVESELSWTPHGVKREAWLNIYDSNAYHYPTREEADSNADPGRMACIRIEWEE